MTAGKFRPPLRALALATATLLAGCGTLSPPANCNRVHVYFRYNEISGYYAREHVDLRRANALQLQRAGVGEVEVVGPCTRCDQDSFSHRRDAACGRAAAFVGLV